MTYYDFFFVVLLTFRFSAIEKSSFTYYNNYHFSDSHEKELVSRDHSLSCFARNETRLVTLLYCT